MQQYFKEIEGRKVVMEASLSARGEAVAVQAPPHLFGD